MVVIHANDPTTRILSQLYKSRNDVTKYISESNTNAEVKNAVRFDTPILMLGHGNQHGLFFEAEQKRCV